MIVTISPETNPETLAELAYEHRAWRSAAELFRQAELKANGFKARERLVLRQVECEFYASKL